jgi:hypothetical protein
MSMLNRLVSNAPVDTTAAALAAHAIVSPLLVGKGVEKTPENENQKQLLMKYMST